jgi:cytochrome c oxidase subunit 2
MPNTTKVNEYPGLTRSRGTRFTRRQFLKLALSAGVVLISGCAAGEGEGGGTDQDLIATGETVYSQNCARCHGSEGAGSGGDFPPLVGSDLVTGDPEPVIEIVVDGQGAMPAFGDELDDEEIAAVVSYIRNTWGNDAGVVDPAAVEALR